MAFLAKLKRQHEDRMIRLKHTELSANNGFLQRKIAVLEGRLGIEVSIIAVTGGAVALAAQLRRRLIATETFFTGNLRKQSAKAQGRYLLFVNDDGLVLKDTLRDVRFDLPDELFRAAAQVEEIILQSWGV